MTVNTLDWVESVLICLVENGFSVSDDWTVVDIGNEGVVVRATIDGKSCILKGAIAVPSEYYSRLVTGFKTINFIDSNDGVHIPVPTVLFSSIEDSSSSVSFYVMEELEWEDGIDVFHTEEYFRNVCRSIGNVMSELHSMNNEIIDEWMVDDTLGTMHDWFERRRRDMDETPYEAYCSTIDDIEKMYQRYEWEEAIVHGDLFTENLILSEEGIVSVLDWDRVRVADPMLDVGKFEANVIDKFAIISDVSRDELRDELYDGYGGLSEEQKYRCNLIRLTSHAWHSAGIFKYGNLESWMLLAEPLYGDGRGLRWKLFKNGYESIH